MKTRTHVYDRFSQAQQAVADLEQLGIPSRDISLIANRHVGDQHENVTSAGGAETGAEVGAAVGGGPACWQASPIRVSDRLLQQVGSRQRWSGQSAVPQRAASSELWSGPVFRSVTPTFTLKPFAAAALW